LYYLSKFDGVGRCNVFEDIVEDDRELPSFVVETAEYAVWPM
jgi:hypothetical protein